MKGISLIVLSTSFNGMLNKIHTTANISFQSSLFTRVVIKFDPMILIAIRKGRRTLSCDIEYVCHSQLDESREVSCFDLTSQVQLVVNDGRNTNS